MKTDTITSEVSALADFETAVHNSIREVFPGLTTKGFSPILPKSREKGTADRNTNSLQRRRQREEIDKRCAVLPLIPPNSIEDVWFQALEDRDEADLTDLSETFTDYITEQWINDDRFLWNHFGTDGPRTINSLEKLAWNIVEECTARSPQHLHHHQDLQGHTERQRNSKYPEKSRRNRLPTIQEICYNQEETADAEGKILRRHHRPYDICRHCTRTTTFGMKI